MKKQKWTCPQAVVQVFQPDEYIAACLTGKLQCMYPGNGISNGQEIYDDYNHKQSGWYLNPTDHLYHGGCGDDSEITLSNGSGYEVWSGVTQYNRKIFNVTGYSEAVGTYTVTWNSQIDGDSSIYQHKGRLVISYVDENNPNRS